MRVVQGDCREVLRSLPDASVHCCVTSPPYFGLRDYGVAGQIGLEPTPDAYVEQMVAVFREVRRVLRDDGTLWLNLGDSYARSWSGNSMRPDGGSQRPGGPGFHPLDDRYKPRNGATYGLKPKDLIGIPWLVAFALRSDGWWLRQDNIWHKPNPMPESVTDRCTKAHEYLFLLVKSERYYYDAEAIAEQAEQGNYATWDERRANGEPTRRGFDAAMRPGNGKSLAPRDGKRNKRSVWTVGTQPFPEAHFATFPPDLIEPCIKAGCPETVCAKCGAPWVRQIEAESADGRKGLMVGGKAYDASGNALAGDNMIDHGTRGSFNVGKKGVLKKTTIGFIPSCECDAGTTGGTVLDPFGGAGTTGLVADRLKRDAILIELNPEYADMAQRRIFDDAPLFADCFHAG